MYVPCQYQGHQSEYIIYFYWKEKENILTVDRFKRFVKHFSYKQHLHKFVKIRIVWGLRLASTAKVILFVPLSFSESRSLLHLELPVIVKSQSLCIERREIKAKGGLGHLVALVTC